MALAFGFRGQLYDDNAPLYMQATDGWIFNRLTRQWIVGQSLADAMATEGYVTTFSTVAGAVAEVGVPSIDWQDQNNAHEFWGSYPGGSDWPGGRDWGDAGVVFPTQSGQGGGQAPTNPVKGPFDVFGTSFWIRETDCMVGFDVDKDMNPEVWETGDEVCHESHLEDRVKAAISAQLVACGCPALMCITAAGNVKKAYQQATLEDKGASEK